MNRNELLEKLGFSKEYIACIEADDIGDSFDLDLPIHEWEKEDNNSGTTSLVISSPLDASSSFFLLSERLFDI